MTTSSQDVLDAIVSIADRMARTCPNCAEQAKQVIKLVGELQAGDIDRASIQDAIEIETADSDLSDSQVRNTTDAVVRATRDEA